MEVIPYRYPCCNRSHRDPVMHPPKVGIPLLHRQPRIAKNHGLRCRRGVRGPCWQLRTAGFSVPHERDPVLHHSCADFSALLGFLDRKGIIFPSSAGRTFSSAATRPSGIVGNLLAPKPHGRWNGLARTSSQERDFVRRPKRAKQSTPPANRRTRAICIRIHAFLTSRRR